MKISGLEEELKATVEKREHNHALFGQTTFDSFDNALD